MQTLVWLIEYRSDRHSKDQVFSLSPLIEDRPHSSSPSPSPSPQPQPVVSYSGFSWVHGSIRLFMSSEPYLLTVVSKHSILEFESDFNLSEIANRWLIQLKTAWTARLHQNVNKRYKHLCIILYTHLRSFPSFQVIRDIFLTNNWLYIFHILKTKFIFRYFRLSSDIRPNSWLFFNSFITS